MSSDDRFSERGTQGKTVPFGDVRRLQRYASHRTIDGRLFEFDQGQFWHTDLAGDEPERKPVEDSLNLPLGPWYHHSLCDCEVCGAEAG